MNLSATLRHEQKFLHLTIHTHRIHVPRAAKLADNLEQNAMIVDNRATFQ